MNSLKGVELSRQGIAKSYTFGRDILYLLQCHDGARVRSYRTENPARASTIAKQYTKDCHMIQITVWVRVGESTMVPMSYTSCSLRDTQKAFQNISRDILCAMEVNESTQVDREENNNDKS